MPYTTFKCFTVFDIPDDACLNNFKFDRENAIRLNIVPTLQTLNRPMTMQLYSRDIVGPSRLIITMTLMQQSLSKKQINAFKHAIQAAGVFAYCDLINSYLIADGTPPNHAALLVSQL